MLMRSLVAIGEGWSVGLLSLGSARPLIDNYDPRNPESDENYTVSSGDPRGLPGFEWDGPSADRVDGGGVSRK